MTRLAIAAALAASLSLASCADTSTLPAGGGSAPATTAGRIAAIRAYAVKTCRFAPTAAFVGKVLAIAEPEIAPGVDIVTQLGQGICDQVRTAYASLRAGGPFGHGSLYGVPVAGEAARAAR